jgi:hypothetical protein
MRRSIHAAVFVALLGRAAHAQVDDSSKSVARTLGEDALRLEQKGDFSGALEKFQQAEALVPVPTLSLRSAHCLEKLGRLVEASERYLRASTLPIDPSAPPAYQDSQNAAKAEAVRLRAALLPRLAHVHLTVKNGTAETLTIDGNVYPTVLVGTALPMDPGDHHVVLESPSASGSSDVTLAEGEDKALEVLLVDKPVTVKVPLVEQRTTTTTSPVRLAGFITLGVGAATVVAGGITYAFALSQSSSLGQSCPNNKCDVGTNPSLASTVSSYDAMRTTTIVLLVAGTVVSAAGLTLVLAAPKKSQTTIAFTPFGVTGAF